MERYHEIQNLHWSNKVHVHPKTIGKVPSAWDFDVSIEDSLRPLGTNNGKEVGVVFTLWMLDAKRQILWNKSLNVPRGYQLGLL